MGRLGGGDAAARDRFGSGAEVGSLLPSQVHELIKRFFSGLLTLYFLSSNTPFLPLGQATYRRRLLGKGLEPDESYYIRNLGSVSQAGKNDLERVPPPDLAIEVEVTVPLLDKLPVYAAIGIPELWQVDPEGEVHILRLENGAYVEADASREIPFFTASSLTEWLSRRLRGEHFGVLQEFRSSLGAL